MTKKDIPELFIAAGAASVLLRHQIEHKEADSGSFSIVLDAFAACAPDMKKLGIPRMAMAEGRIYLRKSHEAYVAGWFDSALDFAEHAHYVLSRNLEHHGFRTPTDDEIKEVHKKQFKDAVAAKTASASAVVVIQGNSR